MQLHFEQVIFSRHWTAKCDVTKLSTLVTWVLASSLHIYCLVLFIAIHIAVWNCKVYVCLNEKYHFHKTCIPLLYYYLISPLLKEKHNITYAYTTITFRAEMLHCVLLQCRNTPGSYQCICPSGTQFNPATRVCADIDECKEFGEEACVGGTCVNVIGSYKCECEEGTIVDSTGRYCIGEKVLSSLQVKLWKRIFHLTRIIG